MMLNLVSPGVASMVDAGGGDFVFGSLERRKYLRRLVFKEFCFLPQRFFVQQKSGGTIAWVLLQCLLTE